MKSLEEYKKEIEKDPKARRRLKKLEKEFEKVEESLTEEELVKYGLKPAETEDENLQDDVFAGNESESGSSQSDGSSNAAAASVIDLISRKQ